MKNLLLVLTVITLTFQSCSKSDDTIIPLPVAEEPDPSPYEGRWSGTYTGDAEGIWSMDISSTGTVSGWFEENGTNTRSTGNGTVTDAGIVSQTFSNGGTSTGRITGTTITGSWSVTDPNNNTFSGTSTGSKE